ncbi:hypothetical protein [Zhihengliuella halotolerans]|uniref:hypothetical protein n=1 Tax=Zhihengliuella halotolerans TaxID=370736 RepID=UPI0015E084CC|nr:hypothetical protein [Zhihengliuella halotolerans]
MPSWVEELLQPERLWPVAIVLTLLWLAARSLIKGWPLLSAFVDLIQTLVGDEDKGQPGIAARMESQSKALSEMGEKLEAVRAQVQNSHNTNMRDDIDGLTETVEELASAVRQQQNDFAVHVAIAKDSDRRQAETAEKVSRLAARWADGGSPRPRTT